MRSSFLFFSLLFAAAPLMAQNSARLAPDTRLLLQRQQTSAGILHAPAQQEQQVAAFLTIEQGVFNPADIEVLGGRVGVLTATTATVRLPLSAVEALLGLPGVTYVQVASKVQTQLDKARTEAAADRMAADPSLSAAFTGKGVVIGVVDAGFDYTHQAFYNEAGEMRIRKVWEQKAEATGKYHAPARYGYGVELDSQELIEEAAGDIVNNSHGTHVAAIAAGSANLANGNYRGVAPDADIILVSVDGNSADNVAVADAVDYIFHYADSLGKPCVVNLSLGMNLGPHDGTSPFDRLADELQGNGKLLVGASGNYRGNAFHFNRYFQATPDNPKGLKTFVNFRYGLSQDTSGGDIDIWADVDAIPSIRLSAYNTFSKTEKEAVLIEPLLQHTNGDASSDGALSATFGSYLSGSVEVAWGIDPFNGKLHIRLQSALTGARANYTLAMEVVSVGEGEVDIWADNTYLDFTDNDIAGFEKPQGGSSMCEVGGTGKRILSVGSYTTRREFQIYRETVVNTLEAETVGDISTFSGCGPTADGRMKPEVAAPGCIIISAVSNNDGSSNRLVAGSYTYPGSSRYYLYGYMQGTSMAAPFVTGTVAAWLQAYPQLSPEQLRQVVQQTARLDEWTGDEATASDKGFGYGKIDAFEGLKSCLQLAETGISDATVSHSSLLSFSAQGGLLLAAPAARLQLSLYTADGRLVASQTFSHVAAGTALSLSSLLPAAASSSIYLLKASADGFTERSKIRR